MTTRKTTTKSRAKKTTTRTASASAAAVETAPAAEGKKRRSTTPRKRRGTATALSSAEHALTPSAARAFGHEHIAHEAFLIWEASGRPHGQELSHWLEAEKRLSASASRVA